MGPKILIALIWLTCLAVLIGLFQVYGAGAFAVLLIIYLIIKNKTKRPLD